MKLAPWFVSAVFAVLLGFVWQDSRSKLEERDAEIESLRQQYNHLLAESNAKLEAAHGRAKQLAEEANSLLKQQADEADAKIQQANLREVPVRVSYRKAMLSSGHVAVFTNTSGQPIAVVAEVQRSSSGQRRGFEMTLDPGRIKEIGEREGWAFVAGDTITLSQPDHKSLTFSFQ